MRDCLWLQALLAGVALVADTPALPSSVLAEIYAHSERAVEQFDATETFDATVNGAALIAGKHTRNLCLWFTGLF